MGDYSNSTKISKTPLLASGDWKEIEDCKKKKCGKCNSQNTICVYKYFSGCIIGFLDQKEFYCKDCGYFTLYEMEYDS